MSPAVDLPWGPGWGQSKTGGGDGGRCGGPPSSASRATTQGADNAEVNESVCSAGGGAGRLSVCLDAEGREDSRGAEFFQLIWSCVRSAGGGLFICPGMRKRGSGTSTLSPRSTLKDSPAVCRSGCLPGRYCPFKSIMAAARGNCFDGSEGRGLFLSHAT